MKKILVIRDFDNFSRILAKNDFEVINFPLIKTRKLNDLSEFEKKLKKIKKYDGIFLTSEKAARILIEKLREKNLFFAGKIYVLGRRSFEFLKTENLDLFFFESANSAREMLKKIPLADIQNKNFLFVGGEKSLRVVPEFLLQFAGVDEAVVYETRKIVVEINDIAALEMEFESSKIVAACFFSPSAAEVFLEYFKAQIPHQTCIATIGKTTADFFERRNLTVDFVSPKATAEDFALGLIDYLGNFADELQKRNEKIKNV